MDTMTAASVGAAVAVILAVMLIVIRATPRRLTDQEILDARKAHARAEADKTTKAAQRAHREH